MRYEAYMKSLQKTLETVIANRNELNVPPTPPQPKPEPQPQPSCGIFSGMNPEPVFSGSCIVCLDAPRAVRIFMDSKVIESSRVFREFTHMHGISVSQTGRIQPGSGQFLE